MGEANVVILDDNNIWQFPSRLADYPYMAVGEFAYNSDSSDRYFTDIGVHYNFGNDDPIVLGLYFTNIQPDEDFPYYLTNNSYRLNNHRIDLFGAAGMSEMKIGFHVTFINGKYERDWDSLSTWNGEPDMTEYSTAAFRFAAGLTMLEDKLDLFARINLLSWKDIGWTGRDISEPDGNIEIGFGGRVFLEMNEKITIVPHGGLKFEKYANKYYDYWQDTSNYVTDKRKITSATIDAGVGLNYFPADGVLGIADVGFIFRKEKDERDAWYSLDQEWWTTTYDDSRLSVPYFKIGLEARVFKWMDIRMGGTSYWDNTENKRTVPTGSVVAPTSTTESRYSFVDNSTYLGLGFKWNRLKIDAYINPELVVRGFNFISGTEQNMNYQVSILYEMM